MRGETGVEPAYDARTPGIRDVEDDDRPCALTERDPHPVPGRADAEVVCTRADEDAPDDPRARAQADHDEPAAAVVRHVGASSVGRRRCEVRVDESTQYADDAERGQRDDRHRSSAWAHDDGVAVADDRDVLGIGRHRDAAQHVAARQRDSEERVLGLGRDERDRGPAAVCRAPRRGHGDGQRRHEHAPDHARSTAAGPRGVRPQRLRRAFARARFARATDRHCFRASERAPLSRRMSSQWSSRRSFS